MTNYYRVYGLTFGSDCELPGLDRIEESPIADYSLTFDVGGDAFATLCRGLHSPYYISSLRLTCRQPAVEVRRAQNCRKFLFRFYDGVAFVVDRGSEKIWVDGWRRTSLQAAIHHLLFSLPGFLLGLRKSACLHGAAIGGEDGAIALLGRSNAGKSVLCAQLATRGIEVLSDELVALDVVGDTVKVYPGYPWICLRSGSLDWLRVDDFAARCVGAKWHYLDESYVTWDLRGTDNRSQWNAKELKRIYLLAPFEDPNGEPAIEQVPRHQALMALMEAAGRTRIPCREFTRQEFSLLGAVLAAIPAYELRYHLSGDGLAALTGRLAEARRWRPTRREHAET